MALKEVITWKVTITGEVTVQASDGDQALKEAKDIFKKMDEHVSWTLTQTKTWIEKAEV
jgi:hypothetical protein